MATITIRDLGKYGIIKDIAEHEMPPEAWSHGRNVAFLDGFVTRSLGESDAEGAPTVVPHYLFPATTPDVAYWVYTNLLKVYAVAAGTHSNITRQTAGNDVNYTGTITDKWNGGWLNGVLVLNNGVDVPQQWLPMSVSQRLVALANFSTTGVTSLKARVIRPFRNFLIALDITKDAVRFPTLVMWSHPADPGTVPTSWDIADATKLTGDFPISDTPGHLVDCAPMGIANIVYKEDAITRMERINSNDVFSFTNISNQVGLMAQNCAQTLKPGLQIFLSHDGDVMQTDGRTIGSVIDKVNRRYLQRTIDAQYRERSFVVVDYSKKVAMICYPTNGQQYCNEIAQWSWVDNTWTFRDLSATLDIKTGFYDQSQTLRRWSDLTAVTWEQLAEPWDVRAFAAGVYRPLGAFPVVNKLREVNFGYTFGTADYESYVERRGLAIVGQDRAGNVKADVSIVKLVTRIRPLIRAQPNTVFQIQVGMQEASDGPIEWQGPFPFQVGVDRFLDFLIEGRLIALRVGSTAPNEWEFYGYDVDLVPVGLFR